MQHALCRRVKNAAAKNWYILALLSEAICIDRNKCDSNTDSEFNDAINQPGPELWAKVGDGMKR